MARCAETKSVCMTAIEPYLTETRVCVRYKYESNLSMFIFFLSFSLHVKDFWKCMIEYEYQ